MSRTRLAAALAFLLPLAVGQTMIAQTSAISQSTPALNDPGSLLALMENWINILAVFVTVVLAFSALLIFDHYRKAEKAKVELEAAFNRELTTLKAAHDLLALKSPAEILADARREYEPLIESLRRSVETAIPEFEVRVRAMELSLPSAEELWISRFSELRAEIGAEIAIRPTEDTIRQQMARNFRPHREFEEVILRKVLNAFIQVQRLSDEERQAVSRELAVESFSELISSDNWQAPKM